MGEYVDAAMLQRSLDKHSYPLLSVKSFLNLSYASATRMSQMPAENNGKMLYA